MDKKKYDEFEKEGIDVLAVDKDGKVLHRTGKNENEKECICSTCTCCSILPDPDPFDWFCDDDVKIICNQTGETIASGLRPHEAFRYKPNIYQCPKY